ncbi:group II intron reverse transcriptase/maturase [Scytonema hofmannii PCC 7110]|uniref:Group II intron reverse transcriptase/maturase n=2 Tax=Scytonema hofmannii TaxID=34078 RepID=A0A139WRV0_9CYAN|nr:group II intron reverse transcriptase/maturase [Scytonema hofmannii PCC 7110]
MKDRVSCKTEIGVESLVWGDIKWKPHMKRVKNLRRRIFRATQSGEWRKVRSLMKLMLRSFSNLLVAIRRVTQLNQGKKTAGVDGFVALKPSQRIEIIQMVRDFKPKDILPTKRVYIPKASGKLRPLGIPSIVDRVKQAIILNAWEPYFETFFEEHSYGFRPGRSTHDAIEQVFNRVATGNGTWILDADIRGAFDNISHDFITERVKMLPGNEYAQGWLKAGYVEQEITKVTDKGTPQGGIISPLLANIALDGIGVYLKNLTIRKKYRNGYNRSGTPSYRYDAISPFGFIRYADDFLITAPSFEMIEAVLPHIELLLQIRGLELNPDKTKLVHIDAGFNYLGFNVRHYNGTTIIKPEKEKVLTKIREIKKWLRKNQNASPEAVINYLNPIIRGFANYYRTVCSKEALYYFDSELWRALYKWGKRRHPNKGKKWIAKKYFNVQGKNAQANKWDFISTIKNRKGKSEIITLVKAGSTPIIRHIKVAGTNSPDDPNLRKYWTDRAKKMGKTRFAKGSLYHLVAEKQKHTCPECGESIHNGEPLHLHHTIPIRLGGEDKPNNLVWLHSACHRNTHSKKSGKEEPSDHAHN